MVKELVGEGQHYRSFLEEEGFNLTSFSKLFFRQDKADDNASISEEELVLRKLACMPDFNDRSWRVTSVVNTDGSDLHLLLVPKDCPRLKDSRYGSIGEMPKPNECYLVEVRCRDVQNGRCKVPVLNSNPDEAGRIAKRRSSGILKVPPKYLEADPQLVTPDQWIEYCRQLILDKGRDLPDFIKRFADLKECAQQARVRRSSSLPSTILS